MGDFDRTLEYTRGMVNSSLNSYYSGVTDYLKWTTTLSIGALIWIGDFYLNLPDYSSSMTRTLAYTSIGTILLSIVFAVGTVRFILFHWEDVVFISQLHLSTLKDLQKDNHLDEGHLDQVCKFEFPDIDKTRGEFSDRVSPWIRWGVLAHMGLLIIGIFAYFFALGAVKIV